jgi:ubiquinone/menaquinone biosynthesis C-methylase UbiE
MERTADIAGDRSRLQAHYDALGAGQDAQAWYEDPAFDDLCANCAFEEAGAVLEVGCGTGRFAERLLRQHLAPQATYFGLDLSAVMVELTRHRLAGFGARCRVEQGDAVAGLPVDSGAVDRVVMAFVLDLLTGAETAAVLREARRVLKPGGLLCAASLARGQGLAQRLRSFGWRLVHTVAPLRVGGCRPVTLPETLGQGWKTTHYMHRSINNCAVASISARPFPDSWDEQG